METRRRGREARANLENSRSSPLNTNRTSTTTPAAVDPPSTRSRTRQGSSSHRVPRASRTTRNSSAGVVTRDAVPVEDGVSPPSRSGENISDRLRSTSSARRQTRAQQPASPITYSTPIPPATRKRTRSSTRANPDSHNSDLLPIQESPLSPRSASVGSRPAKRSRRTSNSTRQSKSALTLPNGIHSSQHPTSTRRARGMSSANPSDSGDQGNSPSEGSRRDEEGPSSLGSDRGAPTTLQGLLRRLGADLSDILPGTGGTNHSRLQQLRTSICSPESDAQQVDALSELCEFLSVGTEESLVSFSVNLFVGPLVNLLKSGPNVEIKIYAARALTHMMEALPSSASAIAINGAAGPLCQNLLSIEYIDLAEQSLSALHKLSVDYPQQIVSANGFQAVLSYIDFFSIGIQRVAASTVCNLCRLPRGDAMEMISGVLPTMMRLLSSEDQRMRESALLGFLRLAEAFKACSEKLELLCGEDISLVERVLGLIVPSSPPALSPQSYSSALRLLAVLSRGSAPIGLRILSTKSLILKLQSRLRTTSAMHSVDCLNLADSLLPDIPESQGTPSSVGGSATRSRRRRNVGSAASLAAVDAKKRESLEQDMTSLQVFGATLFGCLMKYYSSSADSVARRFILSIMSKFISIASKEVLFETIAHQRDEEVQDGQVTSSIRFCPFVATLLGENSSQIEALIGLAMASSALLKLPCLQESFVREGVVHEIVRLAALDASHGDDKCETEKPEAESDNHNEPSGLTQDSENSVDQSTALRNNQTTNSGSTRETDSVWKTVLAIQRGALTRGHRGELSGGSFRAASRSSLDLRMNSSDSVQKVVTQAATSMLRQSLGADANGKLKDEILQNSVLQRLSGIGAALRTSGQRGSEAQGRDAVSSLVEVIIANEGVTVFEVSRSKVLETLPEYLAHEDGTIRAARASHLIQCLKKKDAASSFMSLVSLSLGALSSEEKLEVHTSETLIGNAPASVSSGLRQLTQPFKLRLRRASSETKLGTLRDYSHHVVLIEPLATMASVQEFVWPKVRECPSPKNGRHRAPRSDQTGEEAPDDNADENVAHSSSVEEGNDDGDSVSPEDRFVEMFDEEEDQNDALEQIVQEDDDHNSEASEDDVSSGEEDVIEQDNSESEDHENEGTESLDVDQLGSSLPPFDVDDEALGEAPSRAPLAAGQVARSRKNGSASRQNSERLGPETTFRSYAAALAANRPRDAHHEQNGSNSQLSRRGSSTSDQRRSSRTPTQKLVFTLNGKTLSHECSILTAVIQSSENCGISAKLWSEVHTLSYSKYKGKACPEPLSRNAKETTDANGTSILRRSQRLQGSKGKGNVGASPGEAGMVGSPAPAVLSSVPILSDCASSLPKFGTFDLPAAISPIITILKQLHWMAEGVEYETHDQETLDGRLSSGVTKFEPHFVSHKLRAKLMTQLSDPLALCGGVIPSWCFALTREAAFLIPFETRKILFESTALGVPRALLLLQTRTEIAGLSNSAHRSSRSSRDGEARIARITRQKVRVHRNRILESAIKVMNIYSSHGTVLEVEYFGEVGTGLGPTLEFYTLASREMQRVDLGLWRGSASVVLRQKDSQDRETREVCSLSANSETHPWTTTKKKSRRAVTVSGVIPSSSNKEDIDPPAYIRPTGNGLFPCCVPLPSQKSSSESSEKTTALFAFVGRLIGKAMIDGRLLDLRMSSTFSRLLLSYCRVVHEDEEVSQPAEKRVVARSGGTGRGKRPSRIELNRIDREKVWEVFTGGISAMDLLQNVDAQLAKSLRSISEMVNIGQSDTISSLCLTFVLPGDDSIELIKNGSNTEVTADNAIEFVQRVLYHVLFGGVFQQAEALLGGLDELIDVTSLLAFADRELELLICGPAFENWTVEFLVQATRCDHGYSHESPAVVHLLTILSKLNQQEQQSFVRFITGSSALPIGGLKNLHPRLTIVRRAPDSGRSPDECLPTVMTCTNYLKLPDYTSVEIAKKQIMYAVREGQGAFHLS